MTDNNDDNNKDDSNDSNDDDHGNNIGFAVTISHVWIIVLVYILKKYIILKVKIYLRRMLMF